MNKLFCLFIFFIYIHLFILLSPAAFELKTKLPGSNDRFHSRWGVQELKRNLTDIKKVINSSKSRSSAMFTKKKQQERNTQPRVLILICRVNSYSHRISFREVLLHGKCPLQYHYQLGKERGSNSLRYFPLLKNKPKEGKSELNFSAYTTCS